MPHAGGGAAAVKAAPHGLLSLITKIHQTRYYSAFTMTEVRVGRSVGLLSPILSLTYDD